jgi:hypothetical protein
MNRAAGWTYTQKGLLALEPCLAGSGGCCILVGGAVRKRIRYGAYLLLLRGDNPSTLHISLGVSRVVYHIDLVPHVSLSFYN